MKYLKNLLHVFLDTVSDKKVTPAVLVTFSITLSQNINTSNIRVKKVGTWLVIYFFRFLIFNLVCLRFFYQLFNAKLIFPWRNLEFCMEFITWNTKSAIFFFDKISYKKVKPNHIYIYKQIKIIHIPYY